MNRFESLGSTLNAYRVTSYFHRDDSHSEPPRIFRTFIIVPLQKTIFHLLEHIRHISWFLYIPFCLATLTVASKASSLLISWNAWWSASWFPQRALHKTAASLQSRICSLTWNRKNRRIVPEFCRFRWKKLSKLLTALVLVYPNPRTDFKEIIKEIFIFGWFFLFDFKSERSVAFYKFLRKIWMWFDMTDA